MPGEGLARARAMLRARYVASVPTKIAAIEAARAALAAGEEGAVARAREHAHKLRGSGASYGFPALTEAAGAAEDAAVGDLDAGLARLVEALRAISSPSASTRLPSSSA